MTEGVEDSRGGALVLIQARDDLEANGAGGGVAGWRGWWGGWVAGRRRGGGVAGRRGNAATGLGGKQSLKLGCIFFFSTLQL